MSRPMITLMIVVACFATACDDGRSDLETDGGPVLESTLDARCRAFCDGSEAATPCTGEDRVHCLTQCRRSLAGLTDPCAVCLVDEGFALQPDDDFGTRCVGGTTARITAAECASLCQVDHPGAADAVALRCARHCEIAEVPECDANAQRMCLDECVAETGGLPFGCAACLIDEGVSLGPDDDGLGTCAGGSVSDITHVSCDSYCR